MADNSRRNRQRSRSRSRSPERKETGLTRRKKLDKLSSEKKQKKELDLMDTPDFGGRHFRAGTAPASVPIHSSKTVPRTVRQQISIATARGAEPRTVDYDDQVLTSGSSNWGEYWQKNPNDPAAQYMNAIVFGTDGLGRDIFVTYKGLYTITNVNGGTGGFPWYFDPNTNTSSLQVWALNPTTGIYSTLTWFQHPESGIYPDFPRTPTVPLPSPIDTPAPAFTIGSPPKERTSVPGKTRKKRKKPSSADTKKKAKQAAQWEKWKSKGKALTTSTTESRFSDRDALRLIEYTDWENWVRTMKDNHPEATETQMAARTLFHQSSLPKEGMRSLINNLKKAMTDLDIAIKQGNWKKYLSTAAFISDSVRWVSLARKRKIDAKGYKWAQNIIDKSRSRGSLVALARTIEKGSEAERLLQDFDVARKYITHFNGDRATAGLEARMLAAAAGITIANLGLREMPDFLGRLRVEDAQNRTNNYTLVLYSLLRVRVLTEQLLNALNESRF